MFNFLPLVLPFLNQKKVIYPLVFIAVLTGFGGFSYLAYTNIYNKGYNEAIKQEQAKINKRYEEAVKRIQEENKKLKDEEEKQAQKVIQEHLELQKKFLENQRQLQEILRKSKSGLTNKICVMSEEERKFLNE